MQYATIIYKEIRSYKEEGIFTRKRIYSKTATGLTYVCSANITYKSHGQIVKLNLMSGLFLVADVITGSQEENVTNHVSAISRSYSYCTIQLITLNHRARISAVITR